MLISTISFKKSYLHIHTYIHTYIHTVIVEEVREETPSPSPSGRNSPINGMKKGIDDSTTRSGSGKKSTGYAGTYGLPSFLPSFV